MRGGVCRREVGVLLLAAGRSRRFGTDKRHATLDSGRTLLWQTIDSVREAGLSLRVCLGAEDVELAKTLEAADLATMLCVSAHLGMGATLAEGVAALPRWRAVIIALADMPWITPATYRALAEAALPDGICVPACGGRRGNPVAFGNRFFPELAASTGDRGARDLLPRHARAVTELALDDEGIFRDVDRPGDLQAPVK